MIWGGITFVLLFLLLRRFAYPTIKQGLKARTERIQGDIDAAESAKGEAEGVLAEYKAQLADARSESARIIEEARQAADNLKRDQESRVQAEIAEMRARAAADVEAAKQQAIADRQPRDRGARGRRGRGRRQAQPRPAGPGAAHRGLHQPGRQLAVR